jgi:DNA-3-methyladenine glycosylase II
MFEEATDALKAKDPVLREIIEKVGPLELKPEGDAFRSLAEAIIYQQLSGKAAGTILERFKAIYAGKEFPAPDDVLETSDERLREAGVSKQKSSCLKDLSEKFRDCKITPEKFPKMSDEEVIEHLTLVKGIGTWTAEMFLIFRLGRPNVFPIDDMGFRNAITKNYGFEDFSPSGEADALRERWEPHCTAATLYMWRSLAE